MAEVAATQNPKARSRTAAERAGDQARSRLMRARREQPPRSPHVLRLDLDQFREFITERLGDDPSVTAIARHLGVGNSTVYNALRGNPINGAFVAALKKQATYTRFTVDSLTVADTEPVAA